MSRRGLSPAFGLMASLATASAMAAEPPRGGLLLFPIVVEAPLSVSTNGVASGGALFSQAFRSKAAVRFSAPYQVTDTLNGGGRVIAFPEGTLLAGGVMADDEVYCAPGSNGARGIIAKGDLGVCFRDRDHDGVFDGQMLIGAWSRAQTAYELSLTRSTPQWDAATAAYARVQPEEIPAGEIKVVYFYVDPPFGKPQASAVLRICAPNALTADKLAWGQCGALLQRGGAKLHQEPIRLDLKKADGQALSFGRVSGTIKVGPDGLASMAATSSVAPGPVLMMLAATYGHPGDPATQTSIFALLGGKGTSEAGSSEAQP